MLVAVHADFVVVRSAAAAGGGFDHDPVTVVLNDRAAVVVTPDREAVADLRGVGESVGSVPQVEGPVFREVALHGRTHTAVREQSRVGGYQALALLALVVQLQIVVVCVVLPAQSETCCGRHIAQGARSRQHNQHARCVGAHVADNDGRIAAATATY